MKMPPYEVKKNIFKYFKNITERLKMIHQGITAKDNMSLNEIETVDYWETLCPVLSNVFL